MTTEIHVPKYRCMQEPSQVSSLKCWHQSDRFFTRQPNLYQQYDRLLLLQPYTPQFATAPLDGIDAFEANTPDLFYLSCVVIMSVQAHGRINGDESYTYAYVTPQDFRQHLGYVWNTFRLRGVVIHRSRLHSLVEYARTKDAQHYGLQRAIHCKNSLSEMMKAILTMA